MPFECAKFEMEKTRKFEYVKVHKNGGVWLYWQIWNDVASRTIFENTQMQIREFIIIWINF